jgi:hypothetical protein
MKTFRDSNTGTWLVKAVTDVMDALQTDVDLLTFLTSVQNSICNQHKFIMQVKGESTISVACGQTPELRLFPSPPILVCRLHKVNPDETLINHQGSS